jgi:hypothetical protein
MSLTIGCDIEGWMIDPSVPNPYNNGTAVCVPAYRLIKHTKEHPKIIQTSRGECKLHYDGASIEIASPPADADGFVYTMQAAITAMEEECAAHNTRLLLYPIASIPEDAVDDPEANEIGCEPDFNAIHKVENEKSQYGRRVIRPAGCHFHVSDDDNPDLAELSGAIALVLAYEVIREAPIMMFMHHTDKSAKSAVIDMVRRRFFYGRAGDFRLKPYGPEIRSPGSFRYSWNDVASDLLKAEYISREWTLDAIVDEYKQRGIEDIINSGYPFCVSEDDLGTYKYSGMCGQVGSSTIQSLVGFLAKSKKNSGHF